MRFLFRLGIALFSHRRPDLRPGRADRGGHGGDPRRGFGSEIPEEDRRTDVTIFDITGRAATVKLDAGPWVDYMHLVRVDGEWEILNVLWEMK